MLPELLGCWLCSSADCWTRRASNQSHNRSASIAVVCCWVLCPLAAIDLDLRALLSLSYRQDCEREGERNRERKNGS